jgi:DNA polymerase elongation subunit (family B)
MKIYKNFHLHKNTILVRELKDGIVSKYKIPLKPSYYFVTDKPSQYKSIYGDNLIKMDFNNSFEAKEWADMYKTQKDKIFGFPHGEYIKIHELFPGDLSKQFNINDFNVSIIDIETQAEGRVYPLSYQLKVKNKITDEISTLTVYDFEQRDTSKYLVMQSNDWVEYNASIYYPKGAWPDHESANEEINLISLSIKGPSNKKNKGFFIKTFGTKDVVLDAEDAKDTEYVNCSNEKELLKEFVEYWSTLDIDFLSGWNSTSFDMPYLIKRIVHVFGEEYAKNLSPWKIINTKKTKNDYGKEITLFDIVGISQLDFLLLYKKFSQNEAENYKLDYIANLELDDKKVEYDCSFRELYTKHYDLFTKYNIHDVRLVGLLEKKLGFIALACTMLYRAKVTAPDVFTTVRIWDVIITNYTADRNIFVPAFLSDNSSAGSYGGGYVKDPIVGFYKWLLSIDATSLYPSIERTLNTSPETILNSSEFIKITPLDILNNTPLYLSAVDNAKQKNASLAANGALFSNEKQGIIPALNEMYFNERVVEKSLGKQYEKAASKISKILESRGVSV